MSALLLPDELWRRILEIGGLSYKDLCTDYPMRIISGPTASPPISLLRLIPPHQFPPLNLSINSDLREIGIRERRPIKESQIVEHSRKLRDMETRLAQETHRMRAALVQLSDLHKVSQASVALNNVWQPEIIRGRQKQIVEQCVVPVESRLHALEMELRLCKQQIFRVRKGV